MFLIRYIYINVCTTYYCLLTILFGTLCGISFYPWPQASLHLVQFASPFSGCQSWRVPRRRWSGKFTFVGGILLKNSGFMMFYGIEVWFIGIQVWFVGFQIWYYFLNSQMTGFCLPLSSGMWWHIVFEKKCQRSMPMTSYDLPHATMNRANMYRTGSWFWAVSQHT